MVGITPNDFSAKSIVVLIDRNSNEFLIRKKLVEKKNSYGGLIAWLQLNNWSTFIILKSNKVS